MLKKIAIVLGLAVTMLVVAGGALYLAGARIQVDGGGGVHVAFPKSAEDQAREVARHREAQRAQAASVVPAAAQPSASIPAAPAVPAVSAPEKPDPDPDPPYWTDFRGPRRDGTYAERPVMLNWPAGGLKPLWKQPIGRGFASFVAANRRAFTIEQRGPQEVASAYDIATGRELWTTEWTATFRELMGGDGPRATPTSHQGRVYVLGATGELRALEDSTGRTIWRTNILEDAGATNLQWGMAAAPLIVDDNVVVLPGGRSGQSVVAYNRTTGKRAWAALNDQASYSSPMLVTIGGVRQILIFTASRLAGITPDRGELLWEFPWTTQYDVNASQPMLVGSNRVFISTGYGSGAALIELTRGGDGTFTVREVWRTNRMKNQFTSSAAWRALVASRGRVPVGALAAELGWSRRHLAARFRADVGASPKFLARLLRFEHAAERIRAGAQPLGDVALACGYYDQAHLNREVREFTGAAPGALRAA